LPSLNSDDWRRNLLFSPSIWHELRRQRHLPLTPSSVRCTTLITLHVILFTKHPASPAFSLLSLSFMAYSTASCGWPAAAAAKDARAAGVGILGTPMHTSICICICVCECLCVCLCVCELVCVRDCVFLCVCVYLKCVSMSKCVRAWMYTSRTFICECTLWHTCQDAMWAWVCASTVIHACVCVYVCVCVHVDVTLELCRMQESDKWILMCDICADRWAARMDIMQSHASGAWSCTASFICKKSTWGMTINTHIHQWLTRTPKPTHPLFHK